MTNDRVMSEDIFFVGQPTAVGRFNSVRDLIQMSGGFGGLRYGIITDLPDFEFFVNTITGGVTKVFSPIQTSIAMEGGDSGAPVIKVGVTHEIRGTMIGNDNSGILPKSWYNSIVSWESNFPGINWGI